jgi:glycerol kinase
VDLILALDAGTSGVRTVAFDQTAQIIDSEYRELTQFFPNPGEVEHDAAEITKLALSTLREVATRAQKNGHQVIAVGITNQRETTVAFDQENGQLLHRAIVWQDRRGAPMCEALERDGHGPLVRATTGLVLDPYFSATKMKWLLDHGVLDTATSPRLATIDSWLLWSLSGGAHGGVFATEASNASRTLLMDLTTLNWSPVMTTLFGVSNDLLAPIQPSCSHFATHQWRRTARTRGRADHRHPGRPASGALWTGLFRPGVVKATYGTGAFILANVGSALPGVFDGLVSTVAWDLGDFGATAHVRRRRFGVRRRRGGAVAARRDGIHLELERTRGARLEC